MSIDVQVQQPSIEVHPGTSGRVKFTVTNVGEVALHVVARVLPAGPEGGPRLDDSGLSVDRPSRQLVAGAMDEFVVSLDLPITTTPGSYPVVLHVASSEQDAVQVWGQSPQVAVSVPVVDVPRPPWWPKWLLVAAAILVGAGIGWGIHTITGGDDGWTVATAIERQTLTPSGTVVIGVGNAGPQTLTFAAPPGEVARVTVTEGPLIALGDPQAGDEGARCVDVMADAEADDVEAAIPIDGRVLCTFIGPGRVGAIRVLALEFGELTITMDAWSVE